MMFNIKYTTKDDTTCPIYSLSNLYNSNYCIAYTEVMEDGCVFGWGNTWAEAKRELMEKLQRYIASKDNIKPDDETIDIPDIIAYCKKNGLRE